MTKEQCQYIFSYEHDGNVRDQVFVCKVPQDVNPELHEGAAMKWLSMEEIQTMSLAWEFNRVLPKIASHLDALL